MVKFSYNVIQIIIIPALIFIDCQSKDKNNNSFKNQDVEKIIKTERNDEKTVVSVSHPGKKVYKQYCLSCHMADGYGAPGMNPPLVDNDVVTGDKKKLVNIIYNGMSGPMQVNGEHYNGIMPPNKHLNDKDLKDVVNYIRITFGKSSDTLGMDEVRKLKTD